VIIRLAYSWIASVVALSVAAYLIDGIDYSEDYWVLIVAGLVFALVDTFLGPILRLLAMPLITITLGLALFAVNLLMVYLTAWLVSGLEIQTFTAGLWATLIVTVVNWAFNVLPVRRRGRA
jgi:putative membrane protein